jgi:pimeloyl-ACP methyl ester carboxylesterase
MPTLTPGDTRPVPLPSGMTLHPSGQWQGQVQIAAPSAAVLGDDAPPTTTPLDLFTPAEPPLILDAQPAPAGPAVLGEEEEQQAGLEYHPSEDAVYIMMQEIETSDGKKIYDFTLPQLIAAAPAPGVLGEEAPASGLWFPLNPVVDSAPIASGAEPDAPATGVLGIEDIITGAVGSFITKRVVQMLKSPIERGIQQAIKQTEGKPRMLKLTDSAKPEEQFQPLEGAEAWRALLPPGTERRVLLFVHGFGSSTQRSHVAPVLPGLAPRYDAVLSYEHPTISSDPLQNARDLLAMVPEDLRLTVDIVTHSRGGLVSRSLSELCDPVPQLALRRIVTHGTPHNGTRLADKERWDRLISLGLTAASWLATAAGAAFWVPKLLEFVIKAAAQGIFELPGIAAMAPKSDFLGKLNAVGDPATAGRVRYAAIISSFSIFNVKQPSFQQAFRALATQAFIDAPNDLVVPTASMNAIDLSGGGLPADRQLKVDIDHFSYFGHPRVVEFLGKQLGED